MSVSGQIRIIVVLAVVAFLLSVGVLFVPLDADGNLGSRSDISMAISAIFVLVIGIIAIVIVAAMERTEFRAQETLKSDIAKLSAVINGILNKSAVIQVGRGQGKESEISFQYEKKLIHEFLYGTTGFGILCWVGNKSREAGGNSEEWRTFKVSLHILCITTDEDFARVDLIKAICNDVMSLLESLTDKDIKDIARYLSRLSDAMMDYKMANNNEIFVKAVRTPPASGGEAKAGSPR